MEKIEFKDRRCQYPTRVSLIPVPGQPGMYYMEPQPGEVAEDGALNAEMLNQMQENIEEAIGSGGGGGGVASVPTATPEQAGVVKLAEKDKWTAVELDENSGTAATPRMVFEAYSRIEGLYNNHDLNSTKHTTAEEKARWDAKLDEGDADPAGTADGKVSAHNVDEDSHNDIRLLIEGLTARLNALANSTDEDLDQMAELVAYIKANKALIDQITTGKVSVADIVNNLTTNVANKPLSAAQGVALAAQDTALQALIDALQRGKLDASALTAAINTALAQAKESGEFDGEDGYTPQKGVDYYTPDDKAEIVQELSSICVAKNQGSTNAGKILVVGTDGNLILTDMPEGGANGDVTGVLDENNNILLTGNLADGTYTLKYKNMDGTYSDAGTMIVSTTTTPEPEVIVNLIPTLTDIDLSTIYNGIGYKKDVRISVSNVSTSNPSGEKTQADTTLLGIMPLGDDGDVLHLRNALFRDASASYSGLIWYYDANGALLNTGTINIAEMKLTGTDANGDATFTLTHSNMALIDGTAYVRFNITNPTGELIMTRNQLIPVE